jgi:hypothetical protein
MKMSMLSVMAIVCYGCGTAKPAARATTAATNDGSAAATDSDDAADVSILDTLPAADQAKLMELLQREGALAVEPAISFTTLDGAISGTAAFTSKMTIPCTTMGTKGERACQGDIAYATVGEETAAMRCAFINANSLSLTETLKRELGEGNIIIGPSAFGVEAVADGIAMQLAVDYLKEGAFYTFKVAVLYARGNVAMCSDHTVGLRGRFRDASKKLFSSLRFTPNPSSRVTFAAGYRDQENGALSGFHVVTTVKTAEGSTETSTYFQRRPNKFLSMGDHSHITFRNLTGEHIREVAISGDSRMDIRSINKNLVSVTLHRDGKDSDWKIPAPVELNTEVGMANTIAELISSNRQEAKYGNVIQDNLEPKIQIVTLTRLTVTTLREEFDNFSNELTIDSKGYVSREVSADSTSDRIAVFMP